MSRSRVQRGAFVISIDWTLVVLVAVLIVLGLLGLRSAAMVDGMPHHVTQMVWVLIGTTVAAFIAAQDYRHAERWAYVLYGLIVGLLCLVPLIGTDLNTTAKRWIDFGLFSLQPSELMKIGVILATARFLGDRPRPEGHGFSTLLPLMGILVVPFVLIVTQPDLGTALTMILIVATMLFFDRIKPLTMAAISVLTVVALPFIWTLMLRDYQRTRVLSFLNPSDNLQGDAWQVNQSKIAIGSGRLTGKGYLQGTQVQNGFVPEHENDFVFAHHGEQFGFLGSALLVVLYLCLILWCLRIARHGRDRFGVLIAVGVAAFFFWHVLINLGMVTGMLPVVGLWLPLASYGGSAMVTVMILLGLLMSISLRRQTF